MKSTSRVARTTVDSGDGDGGGDSGEAPLRRVLVGGEVSISLDRHAPYDVTPHCLEHVVLCFVFSPAQCSIRWRTAGGRLIKDALQTEQVYVVPPGSVRSIEWENAAETMFLYIEPGLLERHPLLRTARGAVCAARRETHDPLVWELACMLRRKCAVNSPDVSRLESIAIQLVARLSLVLKSDHGRRDDLEQAWLGGVSEASVRRVRQHILANLQHNLRVSDLAQLLGIPVDRFTEAFKISTGLAPYRYITVCRMQKARELLDAGCMGIREVAGLVGFPDTANFSERFRRIHGCRPRAIRAQARSGSAETPSTRDDCRHRRSRSLAAH